MFQSRLIFASNFQTKRLGEIVSYIETDFYGNDGGGLRLRHAYIRFLNFRIGQTWSGFTDEESWPNITDFDGPATGAWVRQAQIAYFIRPSKNQDILFSVETPLADYNRYLEVDSSLLVANQRIPDLVSHYEIRWPKGHFQLGAVFRFIEYRDLNNKAKFTPGWGFNISGSQIAYKHDKLVYQVLVGTGISRYLVSFGGSGWDAIPDLQGNLSANPVWGGYIGYQHFWGEHTSSTFVYGYAEIFNPLGIPSDKLFAGSYASGNLYWHIVGPLNFAGEVIYGTHIDEFNRFGNNIRFQFVFEYNF
jgi:DcaP outer membrane protein